MTSPIPRLVLPLCIFLAWGAGGASSAAEPSTPANPSVLPAPRVEPAPLPKDESGIYRLHLDRALGAAPLTVLLEVRGGKVVEAVGLPNRSADAWCPADAAKLSVAAGRLTGKVMLRCLPTLSRDGKTKYQRVVGGKPNPDPAPYVPEPVLASEVELDVSFRDRQGTGTWRIVWSGNAKERPFGPFMQLGTEGAAFGSREAVPPPAAKSECELFLYAALANSPLSDALANSRGACQSIWLRLALEGPEAVGVRAFVTKADAQGTGNVPGRLVFAKPAASLRDGRLTARLEGTFEGRADQAVALELEGRAIGRRLFGTVVLRQGKHALTTQWIGFLNDSDAWRWPLDLPSGTWTWRHDLTADADLAAQAARESLLPVMPGEPGKAGFWTWRQLVRTRSASVIHPPSFDLREVEGAKSYRFDVQPAKDSKGTIASCVVDRPWRSLAPLWKDLPPGEYRLTVAAVDAAGRDLPAAPRMGVLDKETARPAEIDFGPIAFVKRPPFDGPYADFAHDPLAASLAFARWHREAPGCSERRGTGLSNSGNAWTSGGDHGYGVGLANCLWSDLACRALTGDRAERAASDELLAFNLEDVEMHQRLRRPEGYVYDYQADTPLAHWSGEAILDAWLQTGEPRWKEAALRLGRALVAMQNERGGFWNPRSLDGPERYGPRGFFTWRVGNTEFAAAELLYLFGRLRRDLGTDEFAEAERKAYEWTMKHSVQDRSWPIHVSHSMSGGYPIWSHAMSSLHFCRYLLECAPPERRDLALAVEVARWSEDTAVDWSRAPQGEQSGPIRPRVSKIDRYNNEPVAVNLLAAVVFEELARATGDRLWSAKGQALAASVLQAAHPETGRPNVGLVPSVEDSIDRQFDDAHFRHNDFSNGWAAQLLREYAALAGRR